MAEVIGVLFFIASMFGFAYSFSKCLDSDNKIWLVVTLSILIFLPLIMIGIGGIDK